MKTEEAKKKFKKRKKIYCIVRIASWFFIPEYTMFVLLVGLYWGDEIDANHKINLLFRISLAILLFFGAIASMIGISNSNKLLKCPYCNKIVPIKEMKFPFFNSDISEVFSHFLEAFYPKKIKKCPHCNGDLS